jgi:hypothetical protein
MEAWKQAARDTIATQELGPAAVAGTRWEACASSLIGI